MALDFPSGATVGQVYTSGNKSWSWNGTGWVITTSVQPDAKPQIFMLMGA